MKESSQSKSLKIWFTFLIVILFFGAHIPISEARWGFNVASGWAASGIHPYRVAGLWSFRATNSFTATHWYVIPIWETSLGYWDGEVDARKNGEDHIVAVTSGPMFRWQYQPSSKTQHAYYLEFGIAASWLSGTIISDRRLSTHFQFEDKLGLGLRFGGQQQYDIGLRATHYSNGSIKRPNNGVNMVLLSVGYWL